MSDNSIDYIAHLKTFSEDNKIEIAGILHSLDDFLDISLFLTVIGLGVAVAAFMLPISIQYSEDAKKIPRSIIADENDELHNQYNKKMYISHKIRNSSNKFIDSIYPAFAGLLLLLPFDGLLDGDDTDALKDVLKSSPDHQLFFSGLNDETCEAIFCLSLLGYSIWQMRAGISGLRDISKQPIHDVS